MKKTNINSRRFKVIETEVREKNNLQEIIKIAYLVCRDGWLYR